AKVEDFIDLERLRYDFPLQLDVQAAALAMRRKVAPFLFIPFVENAFKHGDLHQPVRISLRETPTQLLFSVSNARAEREKDRTGGIGLENVRRRLALLYGEDYILTIDHNEHTFSAELEIALDQC
ncbi:MAG: histidine kinase, partial [Lewinella sp.]|nr:histidine kinase [Lewinella sp.]